MKRYISIILILLCFFVLNNLFAYTSSDNKQISYILELNKSGVNKIYFAESATIDEKDQSIISTPLSNNRHIFPLLSNSTDITLSDNLFFVWELDDATGAEISLKFVSSDTDFNTGYMLQNVNDKYSTDSSKSNNFNYSVSVYKPDTTLLDSPIVVEHGIVLKPRGISQRTIEVYKAGELNNSYVRIYMEVLAPIWEDGGTPAFMDAQYAGYIVAELKFN